MGVNCFVCKVYEQNICLYTLHFEHHWKCCRKEYFMCLMVMGALVALCAGIGPVSLISYGTSIANF